MTGVRDALADYLQLRRRLGFEMPQDGRLLEGFVTFLEAAGAERISTDLALAWARSPGQAHPSYWGQRLTVVRGLRATWRRSTLPARSRRKTCCRHIGHASPPTSTPMTSTPMTRSRH